MQAERKKSAQKRFFDLLFVIGDLLFDNLLFIWLLEVFDHLHPNTYVTSV